MHEVDFRMFYLFVRFCLLFFLFCFLCCFFVCFLWVFFFFLFFFVAVRLFLLCVVFLFLFFFFFFFWGGLLKCQAIRSSSFKSCPQTLVFLFNLFACLWICLAVDLYVIKHYHISVIYRSIYQSISL